MTTDQIILIVNKSRAEDFSYLIEKIDSGMRIEELTTIIKGMHVIITDRIEELSEAGI